MPLKNPKLPLKGRLSNSAQLKPTLKLKAKTAPVQAAEPEITNAEKFRRITREAASRNIGLESVESTFSSAAPAYHGIEPVTGLPIISLSRAVELTQKTPDLPLYVVNISERVIRKGYAGGSKTILAIDAEGYQPNKSACVRVLATSIPQDLTIYDTTRDRILRSSRFRMALNSKYLVIVDTEAAEKYLNTDPSALAEIERLQNINVPDDIEQNEKDEKASEVTARVTAIMSELIAPQRKKAQLSDLAPQMSDDDFLLVLRGSNDAIITTWANDQLKNSK